MSALLTNDVLFTNLGEKGVEAGCRCLLEATNDYAGAKSDKHDALEFAARLRSFRLSFLQRRPVDQNVGLLELCAGHPTAGSLRMDIIKAWLIGEHRQLLCSFLNACGIPHTMGFIDDDAPPPPGPEAYRAAVQQVLVDFPKRTVGIYLGYLVLNGGDDWKNLRAVVSSDQIVALLDSEGGDAATADASQAAPEDDGEATPEDSVAFTTLDNVLIQRAVATATNEIGALSEDQLEDLVEEVVELNSSRHHSYFHRGYFHALFGRPMEFSFRGENDGRRIWYFTGAIMGLLRGSEPQRALTVSKNQPKLFSLLCKQESGAAAGMVLAHLIPVLWEAKEFAMAKRLLQEHLSRLSQRDYFPTVLQVHYNCAALLRRGQWEQAEWFLNFIGSAVERRRDLPAELREQFLHHNNRKRAQALQLKGHFDAAEALLRPMVAAVDVAAQGGPLADLGLIKGHFRSLASVIPAGTKDAATVIADALGLGRELFESACERDPAGAANAHFCLGLLSVLSEERPELASEHFRRAVAGMQDGEMRELAYSEGGILQWSQFLLGVSLLEAGQIPDFQYAGQLVDAAMQEQTPYPLWLWSRAMNAAASFPDTSLGQRIAKHLLERRGPEAYEAIWVSGLAADARPLRDTFLTWVQSAKLPIAAKWDRLKQLLAAALKDGQDGQAEIALDQMESIAERAPDCRAEFIEILRDHRKYSPGWDPIDAEHSLSRLYELDNNSVEGIALLHSRFFYLENESSPAFPTDGPMIIDRMIQLGADRETIDRLRRHLPLAEDPDCSDEQLLEVATSIVYVGGNETQKSYEKQIRADLAERLPRLQLTMIFPGWGSNWHGFLDQVCRKLPKSDALVLNNLVRTQFGRAVRRRCTEDVPWWPCTGRGLGALKSSIEAAARWAAARRLSLAK